MKWHRVVWYVYGMVWSIQNFECPKIDVLFSARFVMFFLIYFYISVKDQKEKFIQSKKEASQPV